MHKNDYKCRMYQKAIDIEDRFNTKEKGKQMLSRTRKGVFTF